MDVNVTGSGDGPANGGAPMIGMMEGSAAPVIGAIDIWAVRLPIGKPAVPELVSKELLWA